MTLETLERKALADKRNEHAVYFPANKAGALLVCWDDVLEYYELSAYGEPIGIDRDEAIDLLNDLMYKAAKRK